MYDLYAVQDVIPRLTPQLFGSRNNKTGNCIHIVDDIKVVIYIYIYIYVYIYIHMTGAQMGMIWTSPLVVLL